MHILLLEDDPILLDLINDNLKESGHNVSLAINGKEALEKIENEKFDLFIKDSTHELNTPVAALLMSVSALKKKYGTNDKLFNHIFVSSKQISSIYNSLTYLAFSDLKKENKIERINFKMVVLEAIEFYNQIAMSRKISIIYELEDTWINIDKDSAKKLINNLLSNAIKYNHLGKNVTITLKEYQLSVIDEGIGIKSKETKEILKRYKRATSLQGGFGIGLDIVNSICKHYKLKLTINSILNQGSTFNISLTTIKE
jgi:two-component system OmpR family sensor kinase